VNVFHDYYRALVQALFEADVSRNVYCVNIDAVIAALVLKILWTSYRSGASTTEELETAAFTLFLYARMFGAAAEIDDHVNRGATWTRARRHSNVILSHDSFSDAFHCRTIRRFSRNTGYVTISVVSLWTGE
jgi:hypothetical protein